MIHIITYLNTITKLLCMSFITVLRIFGTYKIYFVFNFPTLLIIYQFRTHMCKHLKMYLCFSLYAYPMC